ncbi:MAG: hypothetical protein ACYSU0_21555 [Planctomycetota bacterium]|jgi:hypothetical protein
MNWIRRRVKGLGWWLVRTGARLVGLRPPIGLVEIRPLKVRRVCPLVEVQAAPGAKVELSISPAPVEALEAAWRPCMN